jgi:hypothetical protein
MVGYVSWKGYGIFDWRLYMPKAWFEDDHRVLRVKCKVPEQLSFETKNKMLLDMILSAHKSVKLKARYVGVDASYGSDSALLDRRCCDKHGLHHPSAGADRGGRS